jgi:polyhydroxybutyrate depolymerase
MPQFTGFSRLAEREGFAVAYPQGFEKHWNDGRTGTKWKAHKENIDDVGFLTRLIDHISKECNIDAKRIFSTGISNGGLMSYRLALDIPDRIAAIAAVTANLQVELAQRKDSGAPVSVLIMNGTEDPLVPWAGGDIHLFTRKDLGKVISTEDTVRFWVNRNRCSDVPRVSEEPDRAPDDGTRIRCQVYSGGLKGTEVVLYTVEGGGHTWPGGFQYLSEKIIGKTSRDMNATDVIWSFFKTHGKK